MWFLTQFQKLYRIKASTLVTYEATMFVTNFKEFPPVDAISGETQISLDDGQGPHGLFNGNFFDDHEWSSELILEVNEPVV